jgi:hypothetical protein
MWFRSLFDALLARPSRTPVRRRHPAQSIRPRPRSFRPLLEVLEDRTVLSTYTVNALTDTGAGSGQTGDLRYCVTNATSGSDTIDFAPGLTGTIQLQSALPTLNASVDIQGPGAAQLTVQEDRSGFGAGVYFAVGSAATVQISGLTLANGDTAITNAGTVSVSDSTLSGNNDFALMNTGGSATVNKCIFSGNYGAIANYGNLTVNNSTLTGNQSVGSAAYATGTSSLAPNAHPAGNGQGGGIYMGGGSLSINSSTLADNQAVGGSSARVGAGYAGAGYGGGLYIAGGTVSINNSTFADNQAVGGSYYSGGGYYNSLDDAGGGIYNAAGSIALQMYDTILAEDGADEAPDLYGSFTSLGHNLIGNTSGGSGFAASDLLNVNPQLGPLQNNGGPTPTMALLAGSPAIDAGDNTNAPAYDQRGPGFPRIVNGTIDIGAFEVQSGSPTPTPTPASSLAVSGFPSPITAGVPGSFTVSALNADASIDTGYTGTVHFTSSDGQAGLPADYTFTTSDAGTHTFHATLKTAGTQSITATDTTTASLSGTDSSITVDPAAASQLVVSGYPSPTTAGASHSFTVTAEDPYGNVAAGYTGTVHFTSSDAKAGLPANYTFTAADAGTHTFSATLKTAGTQSITATDTTTAGITGTDGGIAVQPAAASKFVLTGPGSVTHGVPFNVTLTAEDAYGNVATGYLGTVHFSSTDSTALLPANYTFTAGDAGVHTFTGLVLHKKGKQKVTATDTLNSSLTATDTISVG